MCVEWGFGDLANLWPRLNFFPKQQVFKTLPGLQAQLGFFLCNARNCVHRNEIGQQFGGKLPTLEEYVRLTMQEAREAAQHNYPGLQYTGGDVL